MGVFWNFWRFAFTYDSVIEIDARSYFSDYYAPQCRLWPYTCSFLQ